jgi:hypothetical protein
MLGRIFGRKMDKVTEAWRNLHNEELRDLYTPPSIIRIINPRRMWWAVHVERIGGKEERVEVIGRKEATRKSKT